MAAFHQRASAAVPLSEAIEFIMHKAASAEGVSLEQVADFCEVQHTAAKNRLAAAMDVHTLVRAQRPSDIGGRAMDVRWFVQQHDADMWVLGKHVAAPSKAAPRTAVQVVYLTHIPQAVRSGADDHRRFGSRRGDRIHYADGSVKHISEAI
jgi:hypothetical protein